MSFIEFAERLGAVPLAIMLLAIVTANVYVLTVGARKKWWIIGWILIECEARYQEREKKLEALLEASMRREEEWKEIARAGGNIARDAVNLAQANRRR